MRSCQLIIVLAVFVFKILGNNLQAQAENPDAVTIPLDFEINGVSRGELIVRATPALDAIAIQGQNLKVLLREVAAENLLPIIESLPEEFTPLEEFQNLGLEITLNLERLVVEISLQEKQAVIEKRNESLILGYERPLHFDQYPEQALVSAYTNFRWRSSQTKDEQSKTTENEHILNMDHVLNVGGFALESETIWRSSPSNNEPSWRVNELRLIKDFPNKILRLSLGDISAPIANMQRGFQLWGLSLSKEFGIQPYSTFTPTGTAEFEIDEKSEIQIMMNGNQVRQLQLDPGTYDIEDYKLISGENNLNLKILTESGSYQEISLTNYANNELLKKGVSAYSLTFGWQKTNASKDATRLFDYPWYERHLEKEPVLSSYYRRGLLKNLTTTNSFQATRTWRRIGINTSFANKFGSFNHGITYNSTNDRPAALSNQLSWDKSIKDIRIQLSTSFNQNGYTNTSADGELRDDELKRNTSVSIGHTFPKGIDTSLSGFHQTRHNRETNWAASARVGKRFGNVYANLQTRAQFSRGQTETGGYFSLTWSPSAKLRIRAQHGVGRSRINTGDSASLSYSTRRDKDSLSADLHLKDSNGTQAIEGSVRYQTPNYSLSASHNNLYNNLIDNTSSVQRSSLSFQAALAYADGSIGFTRNIRDSFVLIAQHSMWKDTELGINPTLGGYEKMAKGRFFKPILPSFNAYREEHSVIQTIDADRFLENNDFYFFPSYKRGTRLLIGNDAVYTYRSTLLDYDEEPVSYKSITLKRIGTDTSINTFTNKTGRFVVSGLSQGDWIISVSGQNGQTTITIEGDETMILAKKEVLSED